MEGGRTDLLVAFRKLQVQIQRQHLEHLPASWWSRFCTTNIPENSDRLAALQIFIFSLMSQVVHRQNTSESTEEGKRYSLSMLASIPCDSMAVLIFLTTMHTALLGLLVPAAESCATKFQVFQESTKYAPL